MGKLLRSYLWWTYERGSLHYDVMVTLILIFLFVSPHVIDYKDKPVETVALHASEVLVKEAGPAAGTRASSSRSAPINRVGRRPARPTRSDAPRCCA